MNQEPVEQGLKREQFTTPVGMCFRNSRLRNNLHRRHGDLSPGYVEACDSMGENFVVITSVLSCKLQDSTLEGTVTASFHVFLI